MTFFNFHVAITFGFGGEWVFFVSFLIWRRLRLEISRTTKGAYSTPPGPRPVSIASEYVLHPLSAK